MRATMPSVVQPFTPDVEQDLAALQSFVDAYWRLHTMQAGAPSNLLQLLLGDLERRVRRGRATYGVLARSTEYLLQRVRDHNGRKLEDGNFIKACKRIRERLQKANISESSLGVAVQNHRIRVRVTGSLVESVGPIPDKLWLDLAVVLEPRGKRASAAGVTSFLPTLPIGFVGREELLKPFLSRARARRRSGVGFSGLPGIGKTTFAVALATAYAETEGGVAAFVDVAARTPARLTTEEIYRTLLTQLGGDANTPSHMLRPHVNHELNAQSGVVVFDDVGDGHEFCDLPAPPGWLFIVTSRTEAPIDGIRWVCIPPLDLPHARTLLATLGWRHGFALDRHRAADIELLHMWQRRIREDHSVSDDDVALDDFAALAYACDGIPRLIRSAAVTLANNPGLAVIDYLKRWTAGPAQVTNLSSLDVLARFASELDAVVAELDPACAVLYRTQSILTGPLTNGLAKVLSGAFDGCSLDMLASHGLLRRDEEDDYRFPPLVHAHARAALNQRPDERRETEWQIARYMVSSIRELRERALPLDRRRELTDWFRRYASDARASLLFVERELGVRNDAETFEMLDLLSDAFVPSRVCASTLIHDSGPYILDLLVSMRGYVRALSDATERSIAAKSYFVGGVASRDWMQLDAAATLAEDDELRRASNEALARTLATNPNVPLRRLAEVSTRLASCDEFDADLNGRIPALRSSIEAMRFCVAIGDLRSVEGLASLLGRLLKKPAPASAKRLFSEISVVLATVAAVRRDWERVRLHARRAARYANGDVIAALQALGAAGQGETRAASAWLSRIKAREHAPTADTMLRRLIVGATLILLGKSTAPLVLAPAAEPDAGTRRDSRLVEAYQAMALLLRAEWFATHGRLAEARADHERAYLMFNQQESRFRRIAQILGRQRPIDEAST